MREFKIRCSMISKIMADAKKAGELSVGAKTYCKEWYLTEKLGVTKEVTSKYLDKGILMEDSAIARYNEFAHKNPHHFEDEFFTGTPDIITNDLIVDLKCPYDPFTMPYFETDFPNMDYWWQLQGYMHLTGKKKAELAYCLEDTPPRNEDWGKWIRYDHIPDADRIRIFSLEYDPAAIDRVIERVKMCRVYIEQLDNLFSQNKP